jgi:hypothetical protein
VKIAINEGWDENYGAGGVLNGPNISFTVPEACSNILFFYNAETHVLAVSTHYTICSILGNDPKPSILDQDVFKFSGINGETIKITLNASPPEEGSGKRVTLMLIDNIKGPALLKLDRSELPNEILTTLPATGEYLIIVAEQPKIGKGERYKGKYCVDLEASTETSQTFAPAFWVE